MLDKAMLDEAMLDEAMLDEAMLDEAMLDEAMLDEAVKDIPNLPTLHLACTQLSVIDKQTYQHCCLITQYFVPLPAA